MTVVRAATVEIRSHRQYISPGMEAEHKIILRLFSRAAARVGSPAYLAMRLAIPYAELTLYLQGRALPPDEVLARAVGLILDELPAIRSDSPPQAWDTLRLPK